MQFRGSFVALVTPFDAKGRIDRKALEQLVEWHIAEGTNGIVCCGTTGEGLSLTDAEKKRVADICIKTAAGRIPIIVGTGLPGTKPTILLTEQMGKLGASACLVVTPYYMKPNAEGCFLHFQEVAKVGIPLIAYYNPGRAVMRLSVEALAELTTISGIGAIKDSSGDPEFVRKLCTLSHKPILSGDDDLTFETLRAGGMGAISVIGNLFPRSWKRMISLALEGKWNESKKISDRFLVACKANFLETNPQPLKFAMGWLRRCSDTLRLPLVPVSEKTEKEMKQIFVSLFLPQFLKRDVRQNNA